MSYNYLAGESGVMDSCRNNAGRIVTVYTTGLGQAGCGFTGILAYADCNVVKLITSVPAAPSAVSGACRRNLGNLNSGNNLLGCTCVIPVDQIVAICYSQV